MHLSTQNILLKPHNNPIDNTQHDYTNNSLNSTLMKKTLFFLISLLLLTTSCAQKNVIIEGTVKDFNPAKGATILLTSSTENFNWRNFKDTIPVDSTGFFKIEIPTDEAIMVGLVFYGSHVMDFISDKGEKHNITADWSTHKTTFNTQSKNQEGIDLMESYSSETMRTFPFLNSYKKKNATFEEAIINISTEREKTLAELKLLYDTQKISKSFYKLAVIDRETLYNMLTATFAEDEEATFIKKGEKTPEQVTNYLENAFSNINNIEYSKAPWWHVLTDMATFREVFKNKNQVEKDSIMKVLRGGKLYTTRILAAKNILTEKKLFEYFTANTIYEPTTSSKFDKELIDNFAQFEKEFPNSKYSAYLHPRIDIIKTYHKKIEDDYSKNVKFVQNADEIDSLEKLLSLFKGKKLYIDIWATWCSPCKKEFKHNKKLKKLLKEKGVEVLYISVDKNDNEQTWKENIKYFGLDGNHIRITNKSLQDDLLKVYKGYIPHYAIIDEAGKIENLNAPRPSSIEALRKVL